MIKLSLPLKVVLPRKRKEDRVWNVNLNVYRNTHYQILNDVKQIYKLLIAGLLSVDHAPLSGPHEFRYTLFPATKRSVDVMNPCSIIDKFACDALVELGMFLDDNHKIVKRLTFEFGEVDKANPRCELEIVPL